MLIETNEPDFGPIIILFLFILTIFAGPNDKNLVEFLVYSESLRYLDRLRVIAKTHIKIVEGKYLDFFDDIIVHYLDELGAEKIKFVLF